MKFNQELTNILHYTAEQSPEDYAQIESFLKEVPDFTRFMKHYNTTSGLSIKEDGTCFDESGVWHTTLKLNNNGEISSFHLIFEGDQSSRKAESNQLRLCLNSISNETPLYGLTRQTLVDFSHIVAPNYRIVAQFNNMTNLSLADIAKLSKPVVLNHFTISSDKGNITTHKSSDISVEVMEI